LHLHPHEDETIYVLAGEIIVSVDGEEHRLGEGGVFVAPPGLPHAFPEDDASRPPDLARLQEVAQRSETIELLGPPPFATHDESARAAPA